MPIGKDSIKTRVAKVAAEAPAEAVQVEAPAVSVELPTLNLR